MPNLELYENHEVMNLASEMMRQEAYDGPLFVEQYDLFAVVRPQYVDPEPDEIVFGDARNLFGYLMTFL